MRERTLGGVMADAKVSQEELSKAIEMSRSTLNRKMNTGNFTVIEIGKICRYLKLSDPVLIFDIFLRPVFQF